VLARERGERPDVVLIASGSEVQLALEAREKLAERGVEARVVSLPCWELFRAAGAAHRATVLGDAPRVAIEAGSPFGWSEWVGPDGIVLGVDRFGQSGSDTDNFRDYGLTTEDLVSRTLGALRPSS
jgi:transketolase